MASAPPFACCSGSWHGFRWGLSFSPSFAAALLFGVVLMPGVSPAEEHQPTSGVANVCLRLRGGISLGRIARISGITQLPPDLQARVDEAGAAGAGSDDWTSDSSALARFERMKQDPNFGYVEGVTQKPLKLDVPEVFQEDLIEEEERRKEALDDGVVSRDFQDAALAGAESARKNRAQAIPRGKFGMPAPSSAAAAILARAAAHTKIAARARAAGDIAREARALRAAAAAFRRGARGGCPRAQYNFAACLLSGRGADVDAPAAVELFRVAARAGHAQGALQLALCLLRGVPDERGGWLVRPRARKGVDALMEAAAMGRGGPCAEAQWELSRCYAAQVGGLPLDPAAQGRWLGMAADAGHAAALAERQRLRAAQQAAEEALPEAASDRSDQIGPSQNDGEQESRAAR